MNYNYGYGYGGGLPYQQVGNPQTMQQNLNNYNSYQGQVVANNNNNGRVKCDYFVVSNLEEVKSCIMNANSIAIFKDVNNKMIYEKKTDTQGISEIRAYKEIDLSVNNNANQYVLLNDFDNFKKEIEEKINALIPIKEQ